MNKIVQNHIEKLFLTSDAATMIRELDIKHPAAKMVVMAAHQQEEEAGDGTNGVVILCSAILAEAEYLLRMGLSVPEVVSGLKTALSYAQEQLESLISHSGKIFNKNNQILDKCHELWPIIMASRDLRTARIGPIFSKFCLSWFMENSSYRRFQNRVALERPISGKLIQNNLVDKKYLTNFGS